MGNDFKFLYCPDLTGLEERKSYLLGQSWDKVQVPILRECLGAECAAYKNGHCVKYDNKVMYEVEVKK